MLNDCYCSLVLSNLVLISQISIYMIPVLTLDGPSAVGKGTVASIIAQMLDWHLLDSGAIYRALRNCCS